MIVSCYEATPTTAVRRPLIDVDWQVAGRLEWHSGKSNSGCFLPGFRVSRSWRCALITQSAAAIDRTIDSPACWRLFTLCTLTDRMRGYAGTPAYRVRSAVINGWPHCSHCGHFLVWPFSLNWINCWNIYYLCITMDSKLLMHVVVTERVSALTRSVTYLLHLVVGLPASRSQKSRQNTCVSSRLWWWLQVAVGFHAFCFLLITIY